MVFIVFAISDRALYSEEDAGDHLSFSSYIYCTIYFQWNNTLLLPSDNKLNNPPPKKKYNMEVIPSNLIDMLNSELFLLLQNVVFTIQ
jgi:hypothetical protein